MSDQFHTRPVVFLNEVAITKGATSTGSWFTMPRAQAFNIWYYMTATGAPSITISFDYSIFGLDSFTQSAAGYTAGLFHPSYASRTNYRTITLGTGITTKDAWTHIDTPDEMKYPFSAARIRVTEADVAAVTTLTVAFGIQGL